MALVELGGQRGDIQQHYVNVRLSDPEKLAHTHTGGSWIPARRTRQPHDSCQLCLSPLSRTATRGTRVGLRDIPAPSSDGGLNTEGWAQVFRLPPNPLLTSDAGKVLPLLPSWFCFCFFPIYIICSSSGLHKLY